MKRIIWTGLAVLALALPARALEISRAEVNGGVGFGDFTQDLGNLTDTGFAWTGRLAAMPNHWIGGELSYLGMTSSVHTLVPSAGNVVSDSDLHQNQFTVDAIAQLPLMLQDRLLAAYVFGGIGYARVSTTAAANAAGLGDSNAFAIPVGAGAKYDLNSALQLDGRFTYNFLTNIDTQLAQSGGSWMVMINLGAHLGD